MAFEAFSLHPRSEDRSIAPHFAERRRASLAKEATKDTSTANFCLVITQPIPLPLQRTIGFVEQGWLR